MCKKGGIYFPGYKKSRPDKEYKIVGFIQKNLLSIVWLLSLLGLFILNSAIDGKKTTQFFGIASSREQSISFQYPVKVQRVAIVEGEMVQEGSVLLEVRRPDLDSEMAIIESRMKEISTRHQESIASTGAELESLRAKERERLAEIDTQIKTLESRYKLNLKFLGEITGREEVGEIEKDTSPLVAEMEGLKGEREHIAKSLQAQIKNLERQLKANVRPADIQLSELEKRKNELQRQSDDLKVRTKFSGSVGSVLYKSGELVAPFSPIVTLHNAYPNYIKGYIHEDVLNEITIGQQVWVKPNSAENERTTIIAIVESLGSRIVEYPNRLKRNPRVPAWGREVVIRLPENATLLLGEKVHIALREPVSPSAQVQSLFNRLLGTIPESHALEMTQGTVEARLDEPKPISAIGGDSDASDLEASGVLWEKNTGKYLLISDETLRTTPFIYEMNVNGQIVSETPIFGAGELDDLESISSDGGYLYVASSLSHSKKGEVKKKRRKFARLVRIDRGFESRGVVDLYDVLHDLAYDKKTDKEVAKFLLKGIEEKSLDLESHAVLDEVLYLGFKMPLDEKGNTVILKLIDVSGLFAGRDSTASIWHSINLTDPVSDKPMLLSDMVIRGSEILLLGVANDTRHETSVLLKYDSVKNQLSHMAEFPRKKAEGVSYAGNTGKYMVVFDGGGKSSSQFLVISDMSDDLIGNNKEVISHD